MKLPLKSAYSRRFQYNATVNRKKWPPSQLTENKKSTYGKNFQVSPETNLNETVID